MNDLRSESCPRRFVRRRSPTLLFNEGPRKIADCGGWSGRRLEPGLEKIEVNCYDGNAAAALYRSLNYASEGRRLRKGRLDNGTYVEDELLLLQVHKPFLNSTATLIGPPDRVASAPSTTYSVSKKNLR